MELISTVVQLRSRQSLEKYPFTGRQVQAWFLREVGRHDPTLANELHQQESESENKKQLLRAYTLSGLYKGPHPVWQLAKGEWCRLRITSLTRELSEFLLNKVLPELLPEARFGQVEFDVQGWTPEPGSDPWSGMETYASLMRQALISKDPRMELDFISPTSFSKNGRFSELERDMPLPIPDMVFGNYLKHWLAFSEVTLPDEIGDFIEDCLVVNEFKIKSERVQFSYQQAQRAATGFTGQVRFAILRNKRFGANWEHYANIVRMLAYYSFYCGTGRQTTVGLGQTRFMNPDR